MNALDKQILEDANCPYSIRPRHIGRPGYQIEHSYLNLGHFWLQQSEAFAENEFIVSETRHASYQDVRSASIVLAYGLQIRYGIEQGDRVAIVSRNTIEFVTMFWALQLLGAIPAAVNAFQSPNVIAACINMVGARLVFVDQGAWETLLPHFDVLFAGNAYKAKDRSEPPLRYAVVVADRETGTMLSMDERPWIHGDQSDCRIHDWDQVMHLWHSYRGAAPPPVHGFGLDSDALLLFTSGTTALPKAVLSTHDQVLSMSFVALWYLMRAAVHMFGSVPSPEMIPKRKTLAMVPMFHVMGLESVMINSALSGDTLAILHKYSLKSATSMIKREQITNLMGVGFMIQEILQSDEDISSLNGFFVGGSSSSASIPKHAKERGVDMGGNGYGLTETNSGVLVNVGGGYEQTPTSVGIPAPMVEVRIMDPDSGQFLPYGQPGELLVRSPNVAQGYYGNTQATAEAFRKDGFFRTGDIAVQSPHGDVTIMDRGMYFGAYVSVKDLIIRKGENISGPMVEQALLLEERVKDCAALALNDDEVGERVAAICVVTQEHVSTVHAHDLVKIAAADLPAHAVPEYIWIRSEALPRNATGKVVKSVLRDELEAFVADQRQQGRFQWCRAARM
ncbi:hypothetical protein MYAM1_003412 [Malassezia yamatoensis]|uniref:Uncharacterized protein n=1 Tax=Malassezia yamatoensis TaxID=253288 RepID=A0AAJ6CIV1_9BASI|nr:hypothetical protein MYAM1_003412 [Malassezia yamatoensis]